MDCCIEGTCLCGSLFTALCHIGSNSVINITSSVMLQSLTYMGNGYLSNITIVGNNITVACNNSGVLSCSYCSNIYIEGITWDQCGNLSDTHHINAISFTHATNISITKCVFQYSKKCIIVVISLSSGFAQVQDSKFLYNYVNDSTTCPAVASLAIFFW